MSAGMSESARSVSGRRAPDGVGLKLLRPVEIATDGDLASPEAIYEMVPVVFHRMQMSLERT